MGRGGGALGGAARRPRRCHAQGRSPAYLCVGPSAPRDQKRRSYRSRARPRRPSVPPTTPTRPRAPRPGNERASALTRAPRDRTGRSAPPAHPTSPPCRRMRLVTPSPAPTAPNRPPAGQGVERNRRRESQRGGSDGTRGGSSQRRCAPPQAAPRAGAQPSVPVRRSPRPMRPPSTVVRCRAVV